MDWSVWQRSRRFSAISQTAEGTILLWRFVPFGFSKAGEGNAERTHISSRYCACSHGAQPIMRNNGISVLLLKRLAPLLAVLMPCLTELGAP